MLRLKFLFINIKNKKPSPIIAVIFNQFKSLTARIMLILNNYASKKCNIIIKCLKITFWLPYISRLMPPILIHSNSSCVPVCLSVYFH